MMEQNHILAYTGIRMNNMLPISVKSLPRHVLPSASVRSINFALCFLQSKPIVLMAVA